MKEPEEIIAQVISEMLYNPPSTPELRHMAAREIVDALDLAGWEIVPRESDDG